MKAMYEVRLSDLQPGDLVKVMCVACGHEGLVPPDKIRMKGVPLPGYTPVLDLQYVLRCQECDTKRRVLISVLWASGSREKR